MGNPVHDFLDLGRRDFRSARWLALGGPSGSGKSTLLRWLARTHPHWSSERFTCIEARPLPLHEVPGGPPHLVLVDETTTLADQRLVVRALARGHRLLVATHLPAAVWWPLRLRWPGELLSTATAGRAKITRELTRRGLSFSDAAVRAYVRHFGPVYPELDLVLERSPQVTDFDRALARFLKFHAVTRQRAPLLRRS